MRPQKIEDQELIENIVSLFRSRGYAGTSLNDISDTTELKKASLYHRFPGGKEEMVHAALRYTSAWVNDNILSELKNSDKKPVERLIAALMKIDTYYKSGNKQCLMRSLSMEIGEDIFAKELHDGLIKWLGAFTKLGVDFGFVYKDAEEKAMKTMILLQGSLVICKTLGTTNPFKGALENIKDLYK